ncbi:glycosyltransferase [Flavobacterium sp. GA093]|uniref:Glycosyltransferase n=1 Tax=Flavobacterium hydrocarbonoxydans TaxID=2683249 RepID=A0A6I4NK28_9FLAO|nr:galactosyltransferase-related protein [Flavobacterium hydrocarbonoxydans]MWB94511.1 glycosyltransferase [Flavobacterium hydrocarbonoxydans]
MITVVLTNRNRDLRIIKKCFDSLSMQSNSNFDLYLVDFGSQLDYLISLEKMLLLYTKIRLIKCPVQGQLWNKSRAINIVLKQTNNPYFLVGDIDMIFRKDFFENLQTIKSLYKAVYFQVGFLGEAESKKEKPFEDYKINHLSSKEATGITLFPTKILKNINGYDEFYHGWGAEDTDVHIRLKNAGQEIVFYDKDIFLLHQWHSKKYRSKESTEPFHSKLEKINHAYIQISQRNKITKVNLDNEWGILPNESDYLKLNDEPDAQISIKPVDTEINALMGQLDNFDKKLASIRIEDVGFKDNVRNFTKKILRKKHFNFLPLPIVNDIILQEIIQKYKNVAYQYNFDKSNKIIIVKINFNYNNQSGKTST